MAQQTPIGKLKSQNRSLREDLEARDERIADLEERLDRIGGIVLDDDDDGDSDCDDGDSDLEEVE